MSPILPSFFLQLNSTKPSLTGEILTQTRTLPPSVQQLKSGLGAGRISLDRWGSDAAECLEVGDLGSYGAETELWTPRLGALVTLLMFPRVAPTSKQQAAHCAALLACFTSSGGKCTEKCRRLSCPASSSWSCGLLFPRAHLSMSATSSIL